MQYREWLQQGPHGHLFHTLCHESRSSHVLLTRFQIFHIRYWASQLARLSHLGLGHAQHQGRKSLHLKCNVKIGLMFFKHSPPLSWANSTDAQRLREPSGGAWWTVSLSGVCRLYLCSFIWAFWKCSSMNWIAFSCKSKMEKCNIRHIWLGIPQAISICTFLPFANLCLLMILLDFKQRTLHMVAALHWSQFKAAADF